MNDPYAGVRRLAARVLYVQLTAVALACLVAGLVTASGRVLLAVAWGGASVALGQLVFARRQFAGVAPAAQLLRRFFGAAAWKWLLLFAVFGTGLVLLKLPAGSLLAGLITAQLAGMWALLRYG
jgi:hypothetical protein